MSLNNQIYQYSWKNISLKRNITVFNQFSWKHLNRLELKFIRHLCVYNGTYSCHLKSLTSTQNNAVQNATSKSIQTSTRNFSKSYVNYQEQYQRKMKSEEERYKSIASEESWTEVYKGLLTTQLKLLKMFSIGSSIIGLSMQPILYEKLGSTNLAIVVTLASFVGFFTFITPALIHWVSKKYVTKLEYDQERDMYAATTLSFFLREKKIHFKVEDVVRPEIPGAFTSFLVKNKGLFVDPDQFEDIEHYSRLMGFDQPIDFSLKEDKQSKS